MHTGHSFICAFYEIIKRYDSFKEEFRLGSFGTFKAEGIFLYLNEQDKTFFFDTEEKIIVGKCTASLSAFFRHFRNYGANETLLNYKIKPDSGCKLNALIFNEIASNFSPEYFEQATTAFNGFLRPLHGAMFMSIDEKRQQYGLSPIINNTEDAELNACIERAQGLLNRKINFDNP